MSQEALLTLSKYARNFIDKEPYASFHFNFAQFCLKQIIMTQLQNQLPNLMSMPEEFWTTLKICVKFTFSKQFSENNKRKQQPIRNPILTLTIQIVSWTMIYRLNNNLMTTIHRLILDNESLLISLGLIRKDLLIQNKSRVALSPQIMPLSQTSK